jgi:hypothetical protein
MVFCSDKAATYLAVLGYNVIRHPFAELCPSAVLGRSAAGTVVLGDLPDLVIGAQAELPEVAGPVAEADINGKSSSALSFRIGTGLLSSFMSALGGSLELSVGYTNAKSMQFMFRDVSKFRVKPAAVATYIDSGELNWDSVLFGPYLEGDGQIFVITDVATASSLTVCYERDQGVGAKVDLGVLGNSLGTVQASADAGAAHIVTYSGQADVAFAFRCFQFGIFEGRPKLIAIKPGGVALDASSGSSADGYAAPGEGAVLTTPEAVLLPLTWPGQG